MTLVLVLAAVAAAAWYVQQRHRTGTGAGVSADARARALRTPRVRLASLLGISTAAGREADRYAAGGVGERRTAALLAPLADSGWTILHDRALPTGRANLDHLVVSPAGMVAVLDSKEWTGSCRLRVVRGRLRHGVRIIPADRAVHVLLALARDYRASANAPGQHPARRAARLFPPYGRGRSR